MRMKREISRVKIRTFAKKETITRYMEKKSGTLTVSMQARKNVQAWRHGRRRRSKSFSPRLEKSHPSLRFGQKKGRKGESERRSGRKGQTTKSGNGCTVKATPRQGRGGERLARAPNKSPRPTRRERKKDTPKRWFVRKGNGSGRESWTPNIRAQGGENRKWE